MRTKILRIPVFLFLGCFIVTVLANAPQASAWFVNNNVKVMTQNLYLGADIFKIVQAAQEDPDSIPYVVAEVFQTMIYTNFWARAEAIANEIEAKKPDIIGLQEVSTFYIQTPGDFFNFIPDPGGGPIPIPLPNPDAEPATEVFIDFYTVLNTALKARGMYYKAYHVTNADVELPMIDPNAGPPFYLSDVRLVDHDYILVKQGNPSWRVLDRNYATNLGLELAGSYVEFTRGYLVVGVYVRGEFYRFVNTHLEVRSSPDSVFRVVQSAQMTELLGTLKFLSFLNPKPTILVGDLNSSPDDVPGFGLHPEYGWLPYVPPYKQAVCAGYLDTWLLQDTYDEGNTSGFDEYLSDPTAELTTRIDHIFMDPDGMKIEDVTSDVVGTDMIPPPVNLWPSDHAGVVSRITFK